MYKYILQGATYGLHSLLEDGLGASLLLIWEIGELPCCIPVWVRR